MSHRFRYALIAVSLVLIFYIVIGGVLGKGTSSNEQTYKDLGVYEEVLSRINSDYVTEPNLQKVTGGAIRGLLEALDPYSTYFSPEQFKDYLAHPEAGPASVGLFVSKRFGFATVVSVLPGSPADKAGIQPADLLDRINGKPVRELSAVQIERKLEGEPGTSVDIWVVDESHTEPQKVTLKLAVVQDPPVVAKMTNDHTAYVRVATFNKGKADEVSSALKGLVVAQGATQIVLDLRDCAGGEPDEAVKTSNLFIEKGLIAYTYGQRSPRHDYTAEPQATVFKQPVAVLINRATAGPAEIVADAILGNKRGDVVGAQSFGMGVVQKVIPVGDGSGLLLSVAKYYGPNGKPIEDNGVTPNIQVPAPGEVVLNGGMLVKPQQFGTKDDIQLQKAIDVLKQQPAPSKAA